MSDTQNAILNIEGEKIALGPLRRDLVPIYTRWINDFEVTRTLAIGTRPITLDAEQEWYDRACKSGHAFTIYERESLRPIGTTGLHNVDFQNRTAEFGLLIGEKDCWGRGYGTEATKLLLDYAFNWLGLHNVWLCTYSYNERAARAYQRAGFKLIGRRREAIRLGRSAYDMIYMDCLATEFAGGLLAAQPPDSQP